MDGRISDFQQVASLRRYTLTEGRGKGLDVIDCDNGRMRFLLNVSKALDVMQLYHGGRNLSFLSKNAFMAREIPFSGRFEGGMLYTCGLDSAGAREGFETHGSLHNIPAEIVRASCGEEGIEVEGIVRDTALFGKSLLLRRRIFTGIGEDRVTVEDTLVNEGYRAENYCLLYHVNLGYPMLDEGARLVADVRSVRPRTAWAEKNVDTMDEMNAPEPGREETCYFLELKEPEVSLVNERLKKRFVLSWSKETLPRFVEWKSMASGDYALGLEPSTTELDGGFRLSSLESGESRKFFVSFSVAEI